MKKSIRKLRLAKDTLHQLDHARSLAGGEDLWPIDIARLSAVQSICVRRCITDPPSECPPEACHPPEALVPRGA